MPEAVTTVARPTGTPDVAQHLACVYRAPAELAASVAAFLAEGFAARQPAVVVATEAHWPLFVDQLAARGWDTEALRAGGELYVVDAEVTLASILDDGALSPERFEAVVGALLDRAAGPTRRFVRAFGEMVDLLCKRGDPEGAADLEDLWNRAAEERSFSLLCGYGVDIFDRQTQADVMPDVCRTHTHVIPASDSVLLDRAVDRALVETLGAYDAEKVYALAAGPGRAKDVPLAQLALMWLTAHMPSTAERVLAAARAEYLGAPATAT